MSAVLDPVAATDLAELPEAEALAARMSVLSDPRRLRILFCIHARPGIRSTDIAAAIGANGSTTSHALAVLRDAGWVQAQRRGREVRYRLGDPLSRAILQEIGAQHLRSLRAGSGGVRDRVESAR